MNVEKSLFGSMSIVLPFLALFLGELGIHDPKHSEHQLDDDDLCQVACRQRIEHRLLSGLAASITGIANIIGSPYLGRLGDRVGQSKLLPVVMFIAGLYATPLRTGYFHAWSSIDMTRDKRYDKGVALGAEDQLAFSGCCGMPATDRDNRERPDFKRGGRTTAAVW
ncbi:hypothetical protein [Effusibacillus pohliae]|uniref:hypothetical protein n=1 Tax=Effusibacillus pohliae TaxID=232270 RepID=UPI001461609F|nr:hypothetical protein [Effusibacillus pohliae]